MTVNDLDAVGDGVADDTDALQAALDAGGTVRLPRGRYRCTRTLSVRTPVRLVGENFGQWYADSVLVFDPTCDGLVVESYTTTTPGMRGDWCSIEGVAFQQMYRANAQQPWTGITLKAPASLRNLWCNGWAGDGFRVEGSVPVANPNLWAIHNCQANECGGNGLTVRGSDSNAGSALLFNASANQGWGISDESFLGNTYIACHTRSNAAGGYRVVGGVNYSVFLGCYAEADQPPSMIGNKHAAFIGGQHGSSIFGGNRWMPGSSQTYWKQQAIDEIPIRVVGHQDGATPLVTFETYLENALGALWSDGSVRLRPYSGGFRSHMLRDDPHASYALQDPKTGYNGPVGDVVTRSSGGAYGQAAVVHRTLDATGQSVDTLALRNGRVAPNALVLPVLSVAQRDRLTSPEPGLVIFNSDLAAIQVYDGHRWTP